MKEKIVYPCKKYLLKTYLLFIFFLLILLFGLFFSFSYTSFIECKVTQIIVVVSIVLILWITLSIIFWFVFTKKNYYVFKNDELVHIRFNKSLHYLYDSIIFIDKKYTLKKKTLLFYTDKFDARYLIIDKDNEIMNLLEKKCNNLLTEEDFNKQKYTKNK